MKLLKTIKDREVDVNAKIRKAARGILFDENNSVPLLFAAKHNYHKLPGGGIEKGEDKITALRREVKEEIGSEIEIGKEVGQIIEFRSEFNLIQTSYCYLGKVISKGEPNDEGSESIWLPLEEAILLVENDKPDDYEGKFIQERDLAFLKEAKRILQK